MIDNLSWIAAYPEIMLLVMSCLIALVDLGVRRLIVAGGPGRACGGQHVIERAQLLIRHRVREEAVLRARSAKQDVEGLGVEHGGLRKK